MGVYGIHRLVYFEMIHGPTEAITRTSRAAIPRGACPERSERARDDIATALRRTAYGRANAVDSHLMPLAVIHQLDSSIR